MKNEIEKRSENRRTKTKNGEVRSRRRAKCIGQRTPKNDPQDVKERREPNRRPMTNFIEKRSREHNRRSIRERNEPEPIKGTQMRRGETLRMRRAHFQGCRSRPRVHSRPRVPYVQGCKGNVRRQVLRITEILKESVGDKSHHQTCMRQRTKGIQVERSPTSTKFQRNMLETTHTYGRNSNTKAPLQGCVRMPSAV